MTRQVPVDRITRKGRIGEAAAWVLAVIAWAISFGTQVALSAAHGFHGPVDWEAVGMGALADLASLSMMLLALDQAERGKSAKLTWLLSLMAAGMMEWANIVYAGSDRVAVLLHAWPPFLAVSIVFVLVHVRRTNAAPTAAGEVIDAAPEPPPVPRPTLPFHVERANAMRALLAEPGGRALSDHQLGARLGIEAGYAGRLRTEIEGGAPASASTSRPEPDRTGPLSGPDRTEPANRSEPTSGADPNRERTGAPEPRALPPGRVTEAAWREALADLGPDASNEQLSGRLGCHADSIRRYRRRFGQSDRPRVVASD